jgi:hypothetical protein
MNAFEALIRTELTRRRRKTLKEKSKKHTKIQKSGSDAAHFSIRNWRHLSFFGIFTEFYCTCWNVEKFQKVDKIFTPASLSSGLRQKTDKNWGVKNQNNKSYGATFDAHKKSRNLSK